MNGDPMKTRPGTSVHREIEQRLQETRAAALVEAIDFLRKSGFAEAAEALDRAAFGDAKGEEGEDGNG